MASSLIKPKLIAAAAAAASYNTLKVFHPVAATCIRLFSTNLGIQPHGLGDYNFQLRNYDSYTTYASSTCPSRFDRRSMAFSLPKLVTKSVFLFGPMTAARSCRFYCKDTILLHSDFDPFDYEGTQNLNGRFVNKDILSVSKVLNDAYCPAVSASRNLARLLNLMDENTLNSSHLGPCKCPRWDVMEDTKALYLVRDMSEFHFPKQENVKEVELPGYCSIFGCVTVTIKLRSIRIIVGSEGPYPGVNYPGYLIDIYLPHRIFKEQKPEYTKKKPKNNITKNVKNNILKITIPKKSRDTIPSITTQLKFYN